MEKQRGMAFGFRKTGTAVKKAGEIDRYLVRKTNGNLKKN